MVTTFYPPAHFGGDAMYVYRLSNALARRGHDVTVVHSVDAYRTLGGPPPAGPFPNHPNVELVPLAGRIPPARSLATYLTGRPALQARALTAAMSSRRFDVTHFHNVSLIGGPGVLGLGSGVKLYTLHEHWLACPMHVLWKNDRALCEQPTCVRCSLAYRRPPQPWRYTGLLERSIRHVDLFLAPSAFTAEEHARRGLRLPTRVLPYFLPDDGERGRDGEREGRPFFLFVGRLERLKGITDLVDTFARYPGADLLVAGDGRLTGRLRRDVAALPNVRLLGFVHPDQLRSLYARAVALVVPSLCYEVFGIVALEAFAQHTPVIVRDRGGLTEVVQRSGGGFTYRTEAELVEAMDRLRADPSLRGRLGSLGHAALVEHWSETPHLDGYFDAIESVRAGVSGRTLSPTP
jgi:glycosyltransferase involved in cell wall biosynthesis